MRSALIFPGLLFLMFHFASCGGNEKSEYELRYDSIQDVFNANNVLVYSFVDLEEVQDQDSIRQLYTDVMELDYSVFIEKYNIRDENLFLTSLEVTKSTIELSVSMQDLMQQTNKLLEEIQLEDDDSLSRPDFDSIEPFKIEYKKVD